MSMNNGYYRSLLHFQHVLPNISHAGGLKLKSVSSSPGHAIVLAEW